MPWPTWKDAAVLAVVLLVVAAIARRAGGRRAMAAAAGARETALVALLYMVWRLARQLPLVHDAGAEERGRQLWRLQRVLHLPSELTIERWVLHHRWLAEASTAFYATAHVPALLAFLVWSYVRHRPAYARWRNALAITTGLCLLIRFVRVAPPRLLPDLGFVDMSANLGMDVYGPVGTGVSDQYAAMPSIHIAWAGVVCFGLWQCASRRWRWIGPAHLALTFWAVVATANHWWLDGIVAMVLLGVAVVIHEVAVRRPGRSQEPPVTGAAEEPAAREPVYGEDRKVEAAPFVRSSPSRRSGPARIGVILAASTKRPLRAHDRARRLGRADQADRAVPSSPIRSSSEEGAPNRHRPGEFLLVILALPVTRT